MNVTVDIQQQKQHDYQVGLYSIESIVDVNEVTQEDFIKWIGFSDEMKPWEPLAEFEAVAPKWLSDSRRRKQAHIESDKRKPTPKRRKRY